MGAVAQEILDRSLRHKLGLIRFENGLVRDIIGLLDAADSDLELRITRAIERHRSEETVQRLKRIRRELQSANIEAYRVVRRKLTADLREAAKRQGRFYADMMESAIPFAFSMTRPSAHLLHAIVSSKPFQGALLAGHVEKLAGNRLSALVNAIEVGLVQGESLSQLLQRVRGTRAGKFKDGVLHRIGRVQAEALTRTATQHVTESARELLIQENDDIVRGTMWVATLDHRTCPLCQPRDGLVWIWDKKKGAYRAEGHDLGWSNGPGRIHWQCRCTAIPVLRSLRALKKAGFDLSKLTPSQRAALERPVPITQNYGDWLRTQSRRIQHLALGSHKRVELFRSGVTIGALWAKKLDPKRVVPATLDEVLPRGAPDGPTIRAELEALEETRSRELRGLEEERAKLIERAEKAFADDDAWREATSAIREVGVKIRDMEAARNALVIDALAGGKALAPAPSVRFVGKAANAQTRAAVDDALETIRRIWGREMPRGQLSIRYTSGRAHYREFYRGKPNPSVYMGPRQRSVTAIHELGHWLETADARVKRAVFAFYERRTASSPLQPMGRGYRRSEKTRPDDFIRRYMGKEYVGKDGRYATEILAMGLELLVRSPWELMRKDPDYFDFLVDLLRGEVP